MTSSHGNIFRVTGHLCGEFTGHRWIPLTKASDAELWCFRWFVTPSCSLRRHYNVFSALVIALNPLFPADAVCRLRTWTPLAQLMARCLTAPRLYLNQYWLTIREVQWKLHKAISQELLYQLLNTSRLDVTHVINKIQLFLLFVIFA